MRSFAVPVFFAFAFAGAPVVASAADATFGTVIGRIVSNAGTPVPGADVGASSPSGTYRARTDSGGRFTLVGVAPDTYVLSIAREGFETRTLPGVVVVPGGRARADAALVPSLKTIGRVTVRDERSGFGFGETQDVYRVSGAEARGIPAASSSGLGSYTQNTVQGAVAAVPGVQQDQFANVILQGGRVEDTVFSYDDVPVPQALIAEPGGNVVGAQLPTTGLGYTTVTTGGMSTSSNQGLSGVIDEIPASGVYPGTGRFSLSEGIVPGARAVELERRWATPDLRRRYAFDAQLGNEDIQYGDGRTFYPSEAATYGLSLSSRATWSFGGNVHVRVGTRDDVSLSTLAGQAVYDQYGTPFFGQTYGAFDGSTTSYPGQPSPGATVATPTRIRGTFAVQKLQDLRSYEHATVRLQLYGSEYGSHTAAPFFDDLSFPNGAVSYYGGQNAALFGLGLDVANVASGSHEISYGAEVRTQRSQLDQLVPTLDTRITSAPTLNSYLAYLSERWTPGARLSLTGTLRASGTWVIRSDGNRYGVSAIDPHLALNYRATPRVALLVAYDRTTQAPNPLESERRESGVAAPFVALAPEAGDAYEVGLETSGALKSRLTYFAKSEHNLVDVLPFNFRSAIASGNNPSGVGIPTNAGNLLVHGFEASVRSDAMSLSATYTRGFSSSASQFGYNALSAPAIAAGHLFPIGYVPDFSAVASYQLHLGRRLTFAPSLSYESGYPYGNGKNVWTLDARTQRPVLVANDNYVNPGYNYYFLRDPARPFDVATNRYIATLGTPEGSDPNTLRTTPQLLASLRVTAELSRRTTLVVDVVNLFANASASQYQGNPYLIGPPGYTGGNAAYAAAYGKLFNGTPYLLGNGVPTNDGRSPALPWRYGTGAYVPSSFPNARAAYVRLVQRL